MHDVLISYSTKDEAIANVVCKQLENSGIRVWISSRDISGGDSYPTAIMDGIKNCSIIVMLFSANSNWSKWVHREIERGVHYDKIIIPFKIEDAQPVHSDIELCTCIGQWLDAQIPPLEIHVSRLAETINRLLNRNVDPDTNATRQLYSQLSPLGQFYRLANRWAKNNYAYFVLESLNEEQKSILRNAPKSIEVDDLNVQLFMLEASLHYGGDWIYWGRQIKDKNILAKHLVKMLTIIYMRPRYRALFLMQDLKMEEVSHNLKIFDRDKNTSLVQLIEKYVVTGKFRTYLEKLAATDDAEVAKRAKTVIFEINRYDNTGKGIDAFPDL